MFFTQLRISSYSNSEVCSFGQILEANWIDNFSPVLPIYKKMFKVLSLTHNLKSGFQGIKNYQNLGQGNVCIHMYIKVCISTHINDKHQNLREGDLRNDMQMCW